MSPHLLGAAPMGVGAGRLPWTGPLACTGQLWIQLQGSPRALRAVGRWQEEGYT